MKNQIIILILAIFLVSITNVSANLYFKQNTEIDLKVPCFNNGNYCSSSASCYITINHPNGTNLIKNELMTNNLAYHNFTLTPEQTKDLGKYYVVVVCNDGEKSGHSTFNLVISRTGEEQTTSKSIIYGVVLLIILVLAISCFTIGIKSEKIPLLVVGVILGFILLIFLWQGIIINPENISSIIGLTGYRVLLWIFWVVMALIFIFMIFYIINWTQKRKLNKLKKWNLLLDDEEI